LTENPERALEELADAAGRGDAEATLEAARRAYAAFLRGEVALTAPVFDLEFTFEPDPAAPTAGTYRGGDEAQRASERWREPFDDFAWEPSSVELGPDTVLIAGEMSGRGSASGVEVAMTEYHVWTLRDGRALRLQMFFDRGDALAAAGINPGA
jgi:ketosteroid isomerase-like protein